MARTDGRQGSDCLVPGTDGGQERCPRTRMLNEVRHRTSSPELPHTSTNAPLVPSVRAEAGIARDQDHPPVDRSQNQSTEMVSDATDPYVMVWDGEAGAQLLSPHSDATGFATHRGVGRRDSA